MSVPAVRTHAVLALPLIPLLLGALEGALEVLGLDVDLAQLLGGLLEVLLGLVELLLEQLDLALVVLAGGPVRVSLLGRALELLELLLGLVGLLLSERELVLERRDLLVTLKESLLVLQCQFTPGGGFLTHLLVLSLGSLSALLSGLDLLLEKGETLHVSKTVLLPKLSGNAQNTPCARSGGASIVVDVPSCQHTHAASSPSLAVLSVPSRRAHLLDLVL